MTMNFNRTYGPSARFDAAPMTEDQMRAVCPSIFATERHESRSERFKPIPTIEIVRGLAKEGFQVFAAKQQLTRVPGKSDFTKHLLRFRKPDIDKAFSVGDVVCEMLLKNANDGTSVYDLFAGLFRIRCLNSMVASMGDIDTVKVRHSGDAIPQVIEGTYQVLESCKLALNAPANWSQIKLAREEQEIFAETARIIRFGKPDAEAAGGIVVDTPIKAVQLLEPRRQDDYAKDLWTTFNVVQEHCLKGGDHAIGRNANGRTRRTSSRPVNGIDGDIKLNRALWVLATDMAKLKTA